MQWLFLVLGLLSALAELHATTFYLAAVSVAAFVTAVAGIWIAPDWLALVFAGLCLALLPGVMLLRRRLSAARSLPDPDVGQIVTVVSTAPESGRFTVSYRGSRWEGVTDGGALLSPGEVAIITAKTDKLLHLAVPAAAKRP